MENGDNGKILELFNNWTLSFPGRNSINNTLGSHSRIFVFYIRLGIKMEEDDESAQIRPWTQL